MKRQHALIAVTLIAVTIIGLAILFGAIGASQTQTTAANDSQLIVNGTVVNDNQPDEEPTTTNTPEPIETPTPQPPTATLEPTETPTPQPPTAAPEPTETPTPQPPTATPEPDGDVEPYADAPACPSHDDRAFHALWDAERGCHYDHEHGDNPHDVDHIFGTEFYDWAGGEISYPWQTPDENGRRRDRLPLADAR